MRKCAVCKRDIPDEENRLKLNFAIECHPIPTRLEGPGAPKNFEIYTISEPRPEGMLEIHVCKDCVDAKRPVRIDEIIKDLKI